MAGLSFVICKLASLTKVKDIPPRLYYLDLYGQYSHFRNAHQFSFTPPVQVLYALHQALKEYFLETSEGRHARYAASYKTLVAGLTGLGFRFLLPSEQNSKLLTAIVEPDTTVSQVVADSLLDVDADIVVIASNGLGQGWEDYGWAATVDGAAEVVVNDETGVLLPPGSIDALAHSLLRLLGSPELRQRLAETGRRRCLHAFDKDVMVAEIDRFYEELAARKRPPSRR